MPFTIHHETTAEWMEEEDRLWAAAASGYAINTDTFRNYSPATRTIPDYNDDGQSCLSCHRVAAVSAQLRQQSYWIDRKSSIQDRVHLFFRSSRSCFRVKEKKSALSTTAGMVGCLAKNGKDRKLQMIAGRKRREIVLRINRTDGCADPPKCSNK